MTPTAEIERSGRCAGPCGLQGKAELFVTPVVDKLLPGQVRKFIRPDHSSQQPCSWSVLTLLSCSSTSMTDAGAE